MSVRVRTRPTFAVAGPPEVLFSGAFDFTQTNNWDVMPDGGFVMVRASTVAAQIRVVFNWFTELRALGRR